MIGLSVFSAELAQHSPAERRRLLAYAADAGLDHLHIGDHVTFHGGYGWDGLINAAALLNLQDALPVQIGIYQLPLRHPTVVARQLSTIHESHPGRLVFGVGVGGDDRAEMRACGVDPRTRGKRMEEGLQILRGLLSGRAVTFTGDIFELDDVRIEPVGARPADPDRRPLGRGAAAHRTLRRRVGGHLDLARALRHRRRARRRGGRAGRAGRTCRGSTT